jgi:hypothetical protein
MIVLASLQNASRLTNTPLTKINSKLWYNYYSDDTRLEDVEELNKHLIDIFQATQ